MNPNQNTRPNLPDTFVFHFAHINKGFLPLLIGHDLPFPGHLNNQVRVFPIQGVFAGSAVYVLHHELERGYRWFLRHVGILPSSPSAIFLNQSLTISSRFLARRREKKTNRSKRYLSFQIPSRDTFQSFECTAGYIIPSQIVSFSHFFQIRHFSGCNVGKMDRFFSTVTSILHRFDSIKTESE